jgi:hypothetical protein
VSTEPTAIFAWPSGYAVSSTTVRTPVRTLAEDAWIVEAPLRDELFGAAPERLWSAVLRRMGREFALLSTMPPDPSLN